MAAKKKTADEVNQALGTTEVPKALRKVARKKAAPVVHADPKTELRRLTNEHRVMTQKAVSLRQMCSDRKNLTTGETIPTLVPDDIAHDIKAAADALQKRAKGLESAMVVQLRSLPVYQAFLSKVFGCGPVVAAYLLSEIDITRSEKVSGIRRFCGLAVINGRLERRTRGVKSGYSTEMRTRIFQLFSAMAKNSAKFTVCGEHEKARPGSAAKPEAKAAFRAETRACESCRATAFPDGISSKYLKVWADYVHRIEHSERVIDRKTDAKGKWSGKIEKSNGQVVSARGFAFSTGWHKAADVFLEDLYIVWRAAEGLPVWPSYYAAKLGYEHLGKIAVNAPKLLTLDEALAQVGDPGRIPASGPIDEETVDAVAEDLAETVADLNDVDVEDLRTEAAE